MVHLWDWAMEAGRGGGGSLKKTRRGNWWANARKKEAKMRVLNDECMTGGFQSHQKAELEISLDDPFTAEGDWQKWFLICTKEDQEMMMMMVVWSEEINLTKSTSDPRCLSDSAHWSWTPHPSPGLFYDILYFREFRSGCQISRVNLNWPQRWRTPIF